MKQCPSCHLNYADDTLEFCLEDGSRLASPPKSFSEPPTVTLSDKNGPMVPEAAAPLVSEPARQTGPADARDLRTAVQTDLLKEKVVEQSGKILSIAPIIISLAHNWWQWLYLENFYYSSFTSYIFSANFLMWLLLLVAGAAFALFALRRRANKGFAIASLVILAVNLLLFLVPRK